MYNLDRAPLQRLASQRGFSLVELLVGLTIGLLVVVAALGSMVFTQISSTVVSDSTRLQQKADNAFRIMGFHLQQAGAINLEAAADPATVRFSFSYQGYNPTVTGAATGQIFSIHGADGTGNATDTLRVSYQDNGGHDCLGNQITATSTLHNVRMDNQFAVVSGELKCTGASGAGAQPVVDGVEDFQVTYGVQSGANFRFYTATQVPDWSNIQAVSVCLQLVGDNKGNPQPGLVVTGCRGQTVANDGLLRRVFRRTTSLRNTLI